MTAGPTQPNDSGRHFEMFMPIEGHKPRLPKRFSWAVGVELLSNRFRHVPQADSVRLWFHDHPSPDYTLTMEQIANRGVAYRILTVWYSYDRSGSKWYVMIYPVEASKRRTIHSMLHDSAFASIDAWLCEPRTSVWLGTSHHLDCTYDPSEPALTVSERPGR
jgi:hypothetical protein